MKNKKALIILGPTAVGKTSLSLKISQEIPSTLISADSRQVYKEMDIVTGKDHPDNTKIYAIDVVDPDEKFSVAKWLHIAKTNIKKAWKNKKLPIIVGGTGLYIDALTQGIDTIGIPPNQELRQKLSQKSPKQLQHQLKKLAKEKLEDMNNSDKNNPRRLIRAIEVALSSQDQESSALDANYFFLGIKPPVQYKKIIEKRVRQRLHNNKAIKETKYLLSKYPPKLESFTGLGYQPLISYIQNEITYDQMFEKWVSKEHSYAKSQLNWFNNRNYINWINLRQKTLPDIVKNIKIWYYKE